MYRTYGFWGGLRLLISLIYTKIYFSNARLIRLPFDIRNRRNIKIGKKMTTGFGCRLEAYPTNSEDVCLILGDNVEMNDYVHIASREKVTIGNNVLIASKVYISDINHGAYSGFNQDSPMSIPNQRTLSSKPVCIEDNVWIGESVNIMPGVTIGEGCIIGAGSVVTKNIVPFSIAVGVPAIIIKQFDFESNEWKNVK